MQSNEKKSVLIFCDVNDCGGGVTVYTQQITQAFIQSGISVYIISHEPKGAKQKEFLAPMVRDATGFQLFPNQQSDQQIVASIVGYAETIMPTWFIPNYREGAHAAMVPLKKMGVGNIFVCHNDHASQYRYAKRYQSVTDIFICPSKKCEYFLKDFLNYTAIERIAYIPHCVDIAPEDNTLSKSVNSERLKLLYCGRVNFEQKKLEYLPLIIKALKLSGVESEVNIIGDGADRGALEKLFEENNLEHVHFHGRVARERLASYFNQNDIVILTSLYEGFCLALAEAMGSGLPAVAFECGGVIDDYLINGENGYIVPFGDVHAFSARVKQLANDRSLYQEFSKNAAKKIQENFSWTSFIENYSTVINTSSNIEYEWPVMRSIYMPLARFSVANFIENAGKAILRWN